MTKGVSDLETCMDYFALEGRSCEKFILFYEDCNTPSGMMLPNYLLQKSVSCILEVLVGGKLNGKV